MWKEPYVELRPLEYWNRFQTLANQLFLVCAMLTNFQPTLVE